MMLPGQEKATKELKKDIAAGGSEHLALSTFYERAFTAGQSEYQAVLQQLKDRCPLCGSSS